MNDEIHIILVFCDLLFWSHVSRIYSYRLLWYLIPSLKFPGDSTTVNYEIENMLNIRIGMFYTIGSSITWSNIQKEQFWTKLIVRLSSTKIISCSNLYWLFLTLFWVKYLESTQHCSGSQFSVNCSLNVLYQ